MKRRKLLCCAGLGVALVFGASSALAQARVRPLGFESTSQVPSKYTSEEAAAVALVLKWIDTTNTKDLAAHMALIDDNVVYRGDPASAIGRGARGYCAAYGFIRSNAWLRLDELYVVGGPTDTLVLLKRTDANGPPGVGNYGGYLVEVGVFARVRNGKITEWLDAPVNRVGGLLTQTGNSRPAGGTTIPEVCMKYAAAAGQAQTPATRVQPPAQAQPTAVPTLAAGVLPYATNKPENRFNVEESSAAQALRAWFAAWQAGNPLLLGAFMDQKVTYRLTPSSDIVTGRDSLLKAVCGTIGGRLDLTDFHVIGADLDTLAIARWNRIDATGNRVRMGSFFRVENGLITEWMDVQLEGAAPAATASPNSPTCQTTNTALAAFAAAQAGPVPPGAAPAAAAPAAAPAGAQPPR